MLLGLLLDRPMHGYELYQKMQTEGTDDWFNIGMEEQAFKLVEVIQGQREGDEE